MGTMPAGCRSNHASATTVRRVPRSRAMASSSRSRASSSRGKSAAEDEACATHIPSSLSIEKAKLEQQNLLTKIDALRRSMEQAAPETVEAAATPPGNR